MMTLMVSLFIGYLLLSWAVREYKCQASKAQAARAVATLDQALYEKYMSPRMSAAEIVELHAERWIGD